MSKIRINELARELEVKPNVILDLLPELGVHDKKTHSSSLDDDVALQVRHRLRFAGEGASYTPPPAEVEFVPPPEATPLERHVERHERALVAEAPPETPPVTSEAPRQEAPKAEPGPPVARMQPLRPPLSSGQAPAMPRPPAIPARPMPSPRPGQI